MNKILFIALVCLTIACRTSKVSNTLSTIDNKAKSIFGDQYATKTNSTGDYSIIFQKEKKLTDLFADVSYIVYDHINDSVIHRDTLLQGSVDWYSSDEIIAVSIINTTNLREQRTKKIYYYDVRRREFR